MGYMQFVMRMRGFGGDGRGMSVPQGCRVRGM